MYKIKMLFLSLGLFVYFNDTFCMDSSDSTADVPGDLIDVSTSSDVDSQEKKSIPLEQLSTAQLEQLLAEHHIVLIDLEP